MLMAARPHRTIALDQGRIVGMSSNGTSKPSLKKDDEKSTELKQVG